jgi:hypothetical protein
MNNRAIVAILAAVLVYAAFSWKSVKEEESHMYSPSEGFKQRPKPQFEQAIRKEPVPVPIEQELTPAGPNSPVPRPPKEVEPKVVIVSPEKPYDPTSFDYESAEIPQRLRYPERAYSPGLVNDEQRFAVESGIASDAHQITQKAYQVFGPEFVQNGGLFMENGVMANDGEVPSNYSSV